MNFKYFAPSWDIQQDRKIDSAFVFWPLILISCLVSINLFTIGAQWLCIDRWIWIVRWKCRRVVWCSCLSVPQLLSSPYPLLTNRGTMLWDKLCWLLALLPLSSAGLPPSNEPLSAPRIFLSFKGKTLKILVCVWDPPWILLCFAQTWRPYHG